LKRLLYVALIATTLLLAAPTLAAVQSSAVRPAWTKNCTALNKRYHHGVGKLRAYDRTTSGDPVTNFRRSTRLYLTAMRWNRGLDRDKDGIACEKH
jgi:Excalibur calcium-binding domain